MVNDLDVEWVVRKHPLPPDEWSFHEILSVTLVSKRYEGHRDPSMESDYESSDDEDEFDEFDPSTFDPNRPTPEVSDEQVEKAVRREEKEQRRGEKVSSERIGISYLVPRVWGLLDGPG